MAISENRITTEKLIQAENEGGDGLTSPPDASSFSSLKNEGLVAQLPSSIGQYSSFKELTSFVQNLGKDVNNNINKALTIPNIDQIGKMVQQGNYNLNQNVINQTLGITKAILCGDDNALVFDLSAIYRALDFDLNFLYSLNICGRQRMRNPIDTLLKGLDNLEYQSKLIGNLGPRFLNTLARQTQRVIGILNLPRSLERCLNQKAILQGNLALDRYGLALGRLKDLVRSLSPDVCRASPVAVGTNNYVLKKVSVQPLISGFAEYDRPSMYSFYSGVLSSNAIEKEILLEILSESFTDTGNTNTYKLLEMVAYTKVTLTLENNDIPTSIGGVNDIMQNVSGSADLALDNILNAAETALHPKPSDVTNVLANKKNDSLDSIKFDAINILSVMEDDITSESKDPKKDFDNLLKLLQIADKTFVPNNAVESLSNCKTTSDLSIKAMKDSSLPELTNTTFNKNDNTYLRVTDDLDLIHIVGSMSDDNMETVVNF